jgi:hypothetical protein
MNQMLGQTLAGGDITGQPAAVKYYENPQKKRDG